MTEVPHRLYLDLSDGGVDVRIVCPGGDQGHCRIYTEGDVCQCTGFIDRETGAHVPCEDCESGDHYACGGDWANVPDLGPGCHQVLMEGVCGVRHYQVEIGIRDMLHGFDWTYDADGAALAHVEWDDGSPILSPWHPVLEPVRPEAVQSDAPNVHPDREG